MTTMNTIELRCSKCGGTMVQRDRKLIMCPYCGSRELIQQSDAVTIKELDVKQTEIVHNTRLAEEQLKIEREREKDKEDLKYFLLMVGVGFLVIAICFGLGYFLA